MSQHANTSLQSGDIGKEQWLPELAKGAERYHIIGAWVAIIFDPIFGITDYINIPDSWQQVFALRLSISAITAICLFLFKRGRLNTYLLVGIPFALISLQNAYTYALIDVDDIIGHNLNYLALFMGAALFILWPARYSIIIIVFSILSTLGFVQVNDAIELNEFAVEGGVLLGTGALFTIFMIEARYASRIREIKARLALDANFRLTERQRDEIASKNDQLEDQAKKLRDAKERIEQMNSKLLDYNSELESQVETRTQKLKKANKEMDQLVYSLSHDFRTPMVNVKGLLDFTEQIDSLDQMKAVMGKMRSAVHRFDELLSDMMNYAVYWDDTVKTEKVLIPEIIANEWRRFDEKADGLNSKPKLETIGFERDKLILSDFEKLRTVFYCLFSNAIRYAKNEEDSFVRVEYTETDAEHQITITDNGQGIQEEHLPKVFDMFYRGHPKSQGAGMGLYIAKEIMKQLTGKISLESQIGKGTSVRISIPKAQ